MTVGSSKFLSYLKCLNIIIKPRIKIAFTSLICLLSYIDRVYKQDVDSALENRTNCLFLLIGLITVNKLSEASQKINTSADTFYGNAEI